MNPPIRIGIELVPQGDASATINTTLNAVVNQVETRLNTSLSRTATAAGSINTSFSTVLSTVQKITTSAASMVYLVEKIGSIARTAFVDPFVSASKAIAQATEDSRKFEYSISGVAGGLSSARQINLQLVKDSQFLPNSVEQLRDAAKALVANPNFSASIGLGSPGDAARSAELFASLSQRLQLLAPEGINADNALRQALGGNYRGLRSIGISPDSLASLSGSTSRDLSRDPQTLLKSIQKWSDVFLPESAYGQITGLVSNRFQKLKDAVDFSLAKVGNSGIFDSVSLKLKNLSTQLFTYFEGPDFDIQAKRISDSLDRIITNVVHSAEHLLNSITGGGTSDLSSVAGAVNTTGNVLDRIAHLSDNLPNALGKLGPSISLFSDKMGKFMDAVINISDFINDPLGGGRVGVEIGPRVQQQVLEKKIAAYDAARARDPFSGTSYGETMDRLQLEYLRKQVASTGISATTRPSTGLPSTQPTTLPYRADEAPIYTLIRQLTGQEYFAPNLLAALSGSNASSNQLRALSDRDETPLQKLEKISDIFGAVTINREPFQLPDLLSRLDQQFNSAQGLIGQALNTAHDSDQINLLTGARDQQRSDYQAALKSIQDAKVADVRDLNFETWKSIGELPPQARLTLQNGIIAGTTDADRRFQEIFGGLPPNGFGIEGFPLDVQRKYVGENIQTGIEALKAAGINLTPTQQQQSLLGFYSGTALPEQQGLLSRAQQQYIAEPTQLNLAQMQAAQAGILDTSAKIRTLRHDLDDAGKAFEQFGGQVRDSFEHSLGDSIDNLITGVGSLRDVWRSFTQEVLNDFSQMAAHDLVQSLVGDFGKPGQGQGGIGSGGLDGIVGNIFTGLFHGGGSTINAYGGVGSAAYGPPAPAGFATGGISYSPQMAYISERGAEAHVPLPDGRSIPVQLNGGGRGAGIVNVHIHTPNADSFRRSEAQIRRQLKDAVAE